MELTSIKKTKKGRYALFIEGEFAFSVSAEQLFSENIRAGNEYGAAELSAMLDASQELFAKEYAMKLLSARRYTKARLLEKLCPLVKEDAARRAAGRLEELGLLDDEDYAEKLASDCYRLRNYGKARVIQALVQKGIDRESARKTAENLEPDAFAAIYGLLERKYGSALLEAESKAEFFKARSRVSGALSRLGYGFDDIKKALDEYVRENA
ncbi:MAG: recombination regulator RecX [Oscillospiraceae bacterium]|jgi:regulatory protein|nr:recombination regulator RecX [Oscillospiraceae bacterium]